MGALLDLALSTNQANQTSHSRDRDERLQRAVGMLREDLTTPAAFVAGEPAASQVLVTVVIRTPQGFVTGEVEIPEDRWDPWLFLRFLEEQNPESAS